MLQFEIFLHLFLHFARIGARGRFELSQCKSAWNARWQNSETKGAFTLVHLEVRPLYMKVLCNNVGA